MRDEKIFTPSPPVAFWHRYAVVNAARPPRAVVACFRRRRKRPPLAAAAATPMAVRSHDARAARHAIRPLYFSLIERYEG